MPPSSTTADVVVLGAGVVGLSAARALAAAGARVVVVERGRVGEEATGAAAGMLAAQAEAEPGSPLLDFALAARARHLHLAPELESETGIGVELSGVGLLEVAFTPDEERRLREAAAWQRARGLRAEPLTPQDLREAEPNLSARVVGGMHLPDDRRVDNVRLVRALAASAVGRGAALLCGRPATALIVEDGRVCGVRVGTETLLAPVVVNATGAWAGLLAGDPQPPPVAPVRGHIVSFDVVPAPLHHVVCSHRGYLVPRADGRVLAGSTMEDAGFDKTVTAGGVFAVLAIALEIAPKLAEVGISGTWAGLRPGTPDGLPVLGAGAAIGLIHASGLLRNGILLGPLVGEEAARLALGQPPAHDLRAFHPARFVPSSGR